MTSGLSNLVFIAVVVGVFYFLVIRPQQKRARQQKEMLAALKPGDEIVTIGGIFATVIDAGDRVRVKVLDGSELELATQAIAQVIPPSSGISDDSTGAAPETAEELDVAAEEDTDE